MTIVNQEDKGWQEGIVIINTHIDDFIVVGQRQHDLEALAINLTAGGVEFEMMGEPNQYLGVRIVYRLDGATSVVQDHYWKMILERVGLSDSNPIRSPGPEIMQSLADPDNGGELATKADAAEFRSRLGGIQYAVNMTRQDPTWRIMQIYWHAAWRHPELITSSMCRRCYDMRRERGTSALHTIPTDSLTKMTTVSVFMRTATQISELQIRKAHPDGFCSWLAEQ